MDIIRNHSRSKSKRNNNVRLIFNYAAITEKKWKAYEMHSDELFNSQSL